MSLFTIARVRKLIRREMTLPMYSDSYRVESVNDDSSENESEDDS